MPVRSLSSSVLKWPKKEEVEEAVEKWVKSLTEGKRGITRVGIFGSLARDEWGVGSDVDLVIIVESSKETFIKRSAKYDTTDLPVPVDLLVYTEEEWKKLEGSLGKVKWIYP